MEICKILMNSIIKLDGVQRKYVLKTMDELNSMSKDELLEYCNKVLSDFLIFKYEFSKISDFVGFCNLFNGIDK